MNKSGNRKLLIGMVMVALALITIRIYPLMTQEENTLSVVNGIANLSLRDTAIFEYYTDSTTRYYISRTKDGDDPIRSMLENDGWSFVEQFGAGFLFEGSADEVDQRIVGSTQFSRYFRIWKVPQAGRSMVAN